MKFIKIAGITTIVLIALAVLGVTLVFAQKPTPTTPPWWNTMQGMMQGSGGRATGSGGAIGNGATGGRIGGMMSGNWQSMQQMHNQMSQNGGMSAMHEWMHQSGGGATGSGVHDTVWAALAKQLGMTPDELKTQIKNGKTLAQIAQEKGVSTKDLAATMETTMKAGLAQAVKDGKLTQEQADLMLQHMDGQYEWMITNMGAGMMGTGSGGMMGPGSGAGGATGSGGCHDNDDTQDTNTSL